MIKQKMQKVGFEPTPFRNRALIYRLRPLGHFYLANRYPPNRYPSPINTLNFLNQNRSFLPFESWNFYDICSKPFPAQIQAFGMAMSINYFIKSEWEQKKSAASNLVIFLHKKVQKSLLRLKDLVLPRKSRRISMCNNQKRKIVSCQMPENLSNAIETGS